MPEIAGLQIAAVRCVVGDHLLECPIEVARVGTRPSRTIHLDFTGDVVWLARPAEGKAGVRDDLHFEPIRLQRFRRDDERRHARREALAQERPSGWYSHRWMSRADQSFTKTNPRICRSCARSIGMGSPSALPCLYQNSEFKFVIELLCRTELSFAQVDRAAGVSVCR